MTATCSQPGRCLDPVARVVQDASICSLSYNSVMLRKTINFYHLLKAIFWTNWYGYPAKKLYVIGVTGTDGKTTTCTLIYEILKAAGYKTGVLTTVSAKYINRFEKEVEIEMGLHTTNPGSEELQPILRQMVHEGVTHMVLEVTSHGLDQNRVWGCNFIIGVLTNITHEHLDYHKNMQNYREAKLKLFKNLRYAVLNADDGSFAYFDNQIQKYNRRVNSNIKIIKYKKTKLKVISPALVGEYNLYNIGAAEAVGRILKIQDDKIQRTVKNFQGVPGRREEVKAGQDFRLFVDFAHTPNALEQVLESLKAGKSEKSKLIAVFGVGNRRTG